MVLYSSNERVKAPLSLHLLFNHASLCVYGNEYQSVNNTLVRACWRYALDTGSTIRCNNILYINELVEYLTQAHIETTLLYIQVCLAIYTHTIRDVCHGIQWVST